MIFALGINTICFKSDSCLYSISCQATSCIALPSPRALIVKIAARYDAKLEVTQKRCPIVFQGYTSNCKVTRLRRSSNLTQSGCIRTVTPVWIYWWIWNDTRSLMWYRRHALLIFGVIHQISRSHRRKIYDLNPIWVRLLGWLQLSNPSDLPCSLSSIHSNSWIYTAHSVWCTSVFWEEITSGAHTPQQYLLGCRTRGAVLSQFHS